MLYGRKKEKENANYVMPIFGSKEEAKKIPQYSMNNESIEPRIAYRLIKDELMDEGNARQNLATFCQTYMEDEATKLMSETFEKNAIDKSEYPRTAELENRCVNMVADLWNAPKDMHFMGTSTVGSSEACMLGGLAMKFAWRNRAEKLGLDINAKKPNLVISSGYQVCWEKFCVYWDVELRTVPMNKAHMHLDIDKLEDYLDEYTIGVVGILGITYSGEYDDIKGINDKLEVYNSKTEYKVFIHVDGASGGLYTPFVEPDLAWDFRLKNVVSINTSGHKYGLVYPGIGWVIWKDEQYLPQELVFKVSYLGGEIPTMAINFSHSASQVIGQYYNFLRFGFEGYKKIHSNTRDVAMFLAKEVEKTGYFEIYNDGSHLPIVCYKQKENPAIQWNLYDLADRLQMRGWQVPAYPMPADMQDVVIQRYVCRADFGMNMAVEFVEDFNACIKELNNAHILVHGEGTPKKKHGYTH